MGVGWKLGFQPKVFNYRFEIFNSSEHMLLTIKLGGREK